MRRTASWAVLASSCFVSACSSLSPEGARVKVYEADLAAPAAARRLPDGCRLLSSVPPVDQMESERHVEDPYRAQRNDTGAKGGNVLLVLSSRFVTRYKTDCSPSDTSADCQSRAQNWYKVGFESYACDTAALDALARIEPNRSNGVASWWPFGKRPASSDAQPPPAAPAPGPAAAPETRSALASAELETRILLLMREGVGTDVLVAYVKAHPPATALTAEEILDWKKSGIAEPVIEAALAQAAPAP